MAARAASAPPRSRSATALGAKVMVTVGSAEKARAAKALGAVRAVNYAQEDFVEAVRETTGGHGADVILDMVGGDYIERNLRAAALDGRIVQIAFLKGSKVEIDLMRLMMRRLTLTGSTLRAQSARGQGAHGQGDRGARLAADRRRQGQAGDRLDLQADRRGRRPPPHRRSPTISARSCWCCAEDAPIKQLPKEAAAPI